MRLAALFEAIVLKQPLGNATRARLGWFLIEATFIEEPLWLSPSRASPGLGRRRRARSRLFLHCFLFFLVADRHRAQAALADHAQTKTLSSRRASPRGPGIQLALGEPARGPRLPALGVKRPRAPRSVWGEACKGVHGSARVSGRKGMRFQGCRCKGWARRLSIRNRPRLSLVEVLRVVSGGPRLRVLLSLASSACALVHGALDAERESFSHQPFRESACHLCRPSCTSGAPSCNRARACIAWGSAWPAREDSLPVESQYR